MEENRNITNENTETIEKIGEAGEKRSLLYRFFHNGVVIIAIASVIDLFVVEALSRHNPLEAVMFMVQNPLVCLCNCNLHCCSGGGLLPSACCL